ncbi:MAG: DUF2085 domain-containing protein [Anaerolineales bacterium]
MSDDLNRQLRERRDKLVRRQKLYIRLQRRWAEILIAILFVYVALPFVAPTLMRVGATGPANALYTIYSPLCHQFAFRSMFLYGEQLFYPRAEVDQDTFVSFDQRAAQSEAFVETYTERRRNAITSEQGTAAAQMYEFGGPDELGQWSTTLQLAARSFRGDAQMGYKVALCARDIAIYGAMVIGGILFLFVRKRLRPVPLLLYAILGLGPIGLDGFSQLISYPPFELWPARESPPELRVLTGFMFGLMNVWLAFPYLEESMQRSANEMSATLDQIGAERIDRA